MWAEADYLQVCEQYDLGFQKSRAINGWLELIKAAYLLALSYVTECIEKKWVSVVHEEKSFIRSSSASGVAKL